jgi:hypothetical protein
MDQFTDVFALGTANTVAIGGPDASIESMSSVPTSGPEQMPLDEDSSAGSYGYWCVVS